jgi:diguanylate cyclase (GGDEF)-like protein/PAS domain S-box-containing protein
MKGLLGKIVTSGAGDSTEVDPFHLDQKTRLALLDDYERTGLAWIWATDTEGRLIYVSPHAKEQLGNDPMELFEKQMSDIFETDPDNSDRTDRSLNFKLKARNKISDLPVRFAKLMRVGRKEERWWSLSGNPKFDASGKFHGYRGSARDITTEYLRQREDSRLAEYDSLTGLSNRHRMGKRLDSILAAYKTAKRSCALMMLDLDRFKQVNDTMGHQAGDDLLKEAASRLLAVVGEQGEVGRLGGDEFQIILPDLDDRGKLGQLAEKIIKIVSQPYPIDGKRAVIGTSVGMAIAPYDGVESEDLVHSADLALYAAKNGGRGQYRFYAADLKDEEEERAHLLDDLREALTQDQLELHYQPVVRVKDDMVIGFEALMRWEHPERGFVSPGLFIPVAEDSSLINNLGEWALRRACEDAAQWPSSVRVAVNVSANQFRHNGFLTTVTNALAHSGLDPDRLELELTESVFLGDSETVDEIFLALKKLGVRLALDDFGTGYSSLSYLRSAPFDKIKVDKSFVDTCTQKDQNSAKIIAAIIGLSNALGMETTVEGVEAFDQLEVVRSKGGKLVQGWIYSKALPNEQCIASMESGEFRIKPDGPMKYRSERRSVFRRIGVIHEDHRYDAVMRDLSSTGASIEGLLGVPKGTGLVLDLGAGQLVVCSVLRSDGAMIGVEFETPLVKDGAGGLVTRHRVSPYALAAAGMPLAALPPGNYPLTQSVNQTGSKPQFMEVTVSRG